MNRKILVALCIVSVKSFCFGVDSPCDDSLYIALKKKDINTLSEREYQFFLNKDKACNEYVADLRLAPASDSLVKEDIKLKKEMAKSEKSKNGAVTVVMILLCAVLGWVIGGAIGGSL